MTEKAKGLVCVFTGDGKGKTSAALGIVLRASGHGWRAFITFFMKGEHPYGEYATLSKLPNVTVAAFGSEGFIDPDNIMPEAKTQAKHALESAREAMLSGKHELVVLDEINVAVAFRLIELEEVLKLIADKPESVTIILTGRKADPRVVERADLVTEMLMIKHPYNEGILAQIGIDY